MSNPTHPESELGERARSLATDASRTLADRANEGGAKTMSSLGKKLDDAADYVRDRAADAAERVHVDPKHADVVADRIHGAASYLQDRDPKSVLMDVDESIQRHPYRALAVGAAVGYLVGRFLRRD